MPKADLIITTCNLVKINKRTHLYANTNLGVEKLHGKQNIQ